MLLDMKTARWIMLVESWRFIYRTVTNLPVKRLSTTVETLAHCQNSRSCCVSMFEKFQVTLPAQLNSPVLSLDGLVSSIHHSPTFFIRECCGLKVFCSLCTQLWAYPDTSRWAINFWWTVSITKPRKTETRTWLLSLQDDWFFITLSVCLFVPFAFVYCSKCTFALCLRQVMQMITRNGFHIRLRKVLTTVVYWVCVNATSDWKRTPCKYPVFVVDSMVTVTKIATITMVIIIIIVISLW